MSNKEKEFYTEKTKIPGLLILRRPTFDDERGFFREFARQTDLDNNFHPVQFNHSVSFPRVLRAFHTEKMNKLIYPITGKMYGAYVDTRPESETFGDVVEVYFDNSIGPSGIAVFIPSGVGNSICVYGDQPVHYIYAVDDYWEKDKSFGVAWDDPDINVKWPVKNPILSRRDMDNPKLRELYPHKFR